MNNIFNILLNCHLRNDKQLGKYLKYIYYLIGKDLFINLIVNIEKILLRKEVFSNLRKLSELTSDF